MKKDELNQYMDEKEYIYEDDIEEYNDYDDATRNYLIEKEKLKKKRRKIVLVGLLCFFVVMALEYKVQIDGAKYTYIAKENAENRIFLGSWNSQWDFKLKLNTKIVEGEITIIILNGRFIDDTYSDEDIEKTIVIDEIGEIDEEIYIGDSPTYERKTVIIKCSSDFESSYISISENYKVKRWELLLGKIF